MNHLLDSWLWEVSSSTITISDPTARRKEKASGQEIDTLFIQKGLKGDIFPVDLNKIKEGISVDGHVVDVETISYVQNSPKKEVGVEIHIGKNRNLNEHLFFG